MSAVRLILPLLLAVALGGCAPSGAQMRAQFTHDFRSRLGEPTLRPFETVAYRNEYDERRYRLWGGFNQDEFDRWALVWADYGRVARHRWEALEYLSQPFDFAPTQADAARRAAEHAAAFRDKVRAEAQARAQRESDHRTRP